MGANMAAVSRQNLGHLPGFGIEVSKFEDWDPGHRRFDLVFAAASWHWIDRETRYTKAASLLREGGSLAVLFSKHAFLEGYDPLFDEIQGVYESEVGSNLSWPPGRPEMIPDEREDMEASGVFRDVQVGRYLWHLDMTADEYISLLGTYSDNRVRPEEERERLFERLREVVARGATGRIRKHYLSVLRVGRT
jgi:SAM-dependent methyltransferase